MSVYQIVEYKWKIDKRKMNPFLSSPLYYWLSVKDVFRTLLNIYEAAFYKSS